MLGQKEENSRQDPHVSMPSAGEGIAAPSCVEGSGGRARQHCNQRAAVSAPFFASIRRCLRRLHHFLSFLALSRATCPCR